MVFYVYYFISVKCTLIICNFSRTYYIWSGKVHLPAEKEIFFRYFVAYIIEPDGKYMKQKQISVHSWESHYEPRTTKLINGMYYRNKIIIFR